MQARSGWPGRIRKQRQPENVFRLPFVRRRLPLLPDTVGERLVKPFRAFDQLPSQVLTQCGEGAGFGAAHFFGQRTDAGASLRGEAEDFLAAVFAVLHDVDLPLIQEFVALGGDGLFGEVPHVADVFLSAAFTVVERVEDDEGGGRGRQSARARH